MQRACGQKAWRIIWGGQTQVTNERDAEMRLVRCQEPHHTRPNEPC